MTDITPSPSIHGEPVPAFDFDKNTAEYRIWKVEEKIVLKSHIEGYRGALRKKKSIYVAEKVVPEIKACWNGRYDKKKLKKDKELRKEWEKKKQRIFTWFGNNAATDRGLKIPGLNFNVTFNTVLQSKKKGEIQELTKRMADGSEDPKKWLPHYQTAKKIVKDGLTEEEISMFEEDVRVWQATGVPREVQAASASRHGSKILLKMDQLRWRSIGMRVFALECHYNEDGKMAYSIRDTQTLIADGVLPIPVMADPAAAQRVRQVPTFEQYDPSMYKALRKSYVKYVKHVSSIEKGTTTATAPDFSTFKMTDLDVEASGYPRVPDPIRNVNNIETNVTQQQIIRSYFTKHYNLAAGKDGPVPYKTILPEWKEYVDPKYLPEGMPLKDPSKYLTEESNSILKLWRARRDKGEMYFRFECIVGSDKLPAEPDYPDGIFEDLQPVTPMNFSGLGPQCEDAEKSDDEDSDDGDAIPKKFRIGTPEEESEQSEGGDPGKDLENERIPKRYRLWSPEAGEGPDAQEPDNNGEERASDIDEDEEVDHIQNLNRGRRSRKGRVMSVDSQGTGSPTKTTPRAPRRLEISPTFDSSPTLAGSSPMTQTTGQPREGTRSKTRVEARVLLTPEATVQSSESSPQKRQLRPRKTATTGTRVVKPVAKKKTGKGKNS